MKNYIVRSREKKTILKVNDRRWKPGLKKKLYCRRKQHLKKSHRKSNYIVKNAIL